MAILKLENSAVVLTLRAVPDTDDLLVEQVRDIIRESRFIIFNIKGITFTTILIGDIINVLNLFEEHWKDRSHRMMFVQADPTAKRIFDLTKLSKKIPVYDSVDDAIGDLPPVL